MFSLRIGLSSSDPCWSRLLYVHFPDYGGILEHTQNGRFVIGPTLIYSMAEPVCRNEIVIWLASGRRIRDDLFADLESIPRYTLIDDMDNATASYTHGMSSGLMP